LSLATCWTVKERPVVGVEFAWLSCVDISGRGEAVIVAERTAKGKVVYLENNIMKQMWKFFWKMMMICRRQCSVNCGVLMMRKIEHGNV